MRSHFLRTVRKPELSYVGISSNEVGATTTLTLSPPAGVAQGDLLIALVLYNGTDAGWSASGWTEVRDASGRAVYWKTAGASEGNSTFTFGTTSTLSGHMIAYRNAAYDVVGTTQADPAASITLSSAGSVVILFASRATAGSVTWSGQTGFTTLVTEGNLGAPSSAVYHKLNQPSGATGTVAILTLSATGFLVGVKPA